MVLATPPSAPPPVPQLPPPPQSATAPKSKMAAFAAAALETGRRFSKNAARRGLHYIQNNRQKVALDVAVGTAAAFVAHHGFHTGFWRTVETLVVAGIATHFVAKEIRANGVRRIRKVGAPFRGIGSGAAFVARTKFARNIVPIAAGLTVAYLAYDKGYTPKSPAGYVEDVLVFAATAAITRWTFGTLLQPTIRRVAAGAIVAAGVTILAPFVTNWAVDQGLMPMDSPTVAFVHKWGHNLGLDQYTPNAKVFAPILLQNGVINDGPAVANNSEALYTGTDLDKSGKAPLEILPPATAVCITFPGDGLLQITMKDGTRLYTQNSSDWSPAPGSDACVRPAAPVVPPKGSTPT